jgi:hypothetical protein
MAGTDRLRQITDVPREGAVRSVAELVTVALDDFAIDTTAGAVTCPKDTPSNSPRPADSTSNAGRSSGTCAPDAHCANAAPKRRPGAS